MIEIFRVIVPVTDIDRAARFYAQLLDQRGERVGRGRHYFRCGHTVLACFDPAAEGDDIEPRPNVAPVYFAVDGVEDWFERARRASCGWLEEEIRTRAWGERSFYARDPFDNPLSFVERSTAFVTSRSDAGPSKEQRRSRKDTSPGVT